MIAAMDAIGGYLMPAESAPQDRVWMAFPCAGYSLGDTAEEQHEARSTWAAVAHAVAEFEPVTMVVHPAERAIADRAGATVGPPLWGDSLGDARSTGATYLDMLRFNAGALATGFTGDPEACDLAAG